MKSLSVFSLVIRNCLRERRCSGLGIRHIALTILCFLSDSRDTNTARQLAMGSVQKLKRSRSWHLANFSCASWTAEFESTASTTVPAKIRCLFLVRNLVILAALSSCGTLMVGGSE